MKKVLFVTYDFPYPTNTGGKNRAYHMLKYSGKEFKKYLFSFVRSDFDGKYVEEMEKIDVEVVHTEPRRKLRDPKNVIRLLARNSIFKSLYYSNSVLDKICSIIREKEIDVVHFESFYTSFFISDEIHALGAKQVFGTENIEHILYQEFAKKAPFFTKPLYDIQVKKIKEEEISFFKKADVCVAVSEPDAEKIRKYAECEIVRNGVDIENLKYKEPNKIARKLLFVGNFSYFPNVDAINFFYNEVFKKLTGDIQLTIVGKKVSELSFLPDPRVEAIEFIPEISDAYRDADIMVAPIRHGGGTNFKVLEGMAAGLPIVALPDRLEGLDITDGKNILIAKDALEFKEKCEKLIGDFELRKKLAENARKLIEQEYSWKVIGNNLATVWKNL